MKMNIRDFSGNGYASSLCSLLSDFQSFSLILRSSLGFGLDNLGQSRFYLPCVKLRNSLKKKNLKNNVKILLAYRNVDPNRRADWSAFGSPTLGADVRQNGVKKSPSQLHFKLFFKLPLNTLLTQSCCSPFLLLFNIAKKVRFRQLQNEAKGFR